MPNAIVAGATGILGREILYEIAKSEEWQQVFALSRSQKEEYPSKVQHQHIDLQASPKEMAAELKGVEAEYLFFSAYLAKDDEGEASDVNGGMLRNFLEALRITGAEKKLKRVILVTGAKQYALHLGRPKMPMEESDPWIEGPEWPPNFYYTQQRVLIEMAAESSWDWVVTYPNDVIGVAWNNFMNLSLPLALYALTTREMGEDLVWPGSPEFYMAKTTFTSAKHHAKFCHWAAKQPQCKNQGFNVINGDVVSWQSLWPKLAKRFGTKVAPDQLSRHIPEEAGSCQILHSKPPISVYAAELGIEGTPAMQPSKVENRISLAKWSRREDVRLAWERLAAKSNVDKELWDRTTWSFCDFILGRNFDIVISASKARQFGFAEFQDTWAALDTIWTEMERCGAIPASAK